MATPSSPRGESTPDPVYDSTAEDSKHSSNLRKRNREASPDGFDDSFWDLNDDGRPKTRRVNPQRLAVRLGPDLVAEMEALIVPGAKMPTFAIRKDFQERYNVDRRHIYDYFHSRGLRVAKEDKHTNLIRGRAMKAQAQAQALAEAQAKLNYVSVKEESPPCEIPMNSLPTPIIRESLIFPKPRGRVAKKADKMKERKPRAYKFKKKVPDRPPITDSPTLISVDVCQDTPPVGTTSTKASTSEIETDCDSEAPCPLFTLPDDNANDTSNASVSTSTSLSDFLHSPDDFVVGYFDYPTQMQEPLVEFDDSVSVPLDVNLVDEHHHLMDELERTQVYDLINKNVYLGPGNDNGNYFSFADEVSHSYYDNISGAGESWTFGMNKTAFNDSASMDFPDLRKWLADDLDLRQNLFDIQDYNPISDDSCMNSCNPLLAGRYGLSGHSEVLPLQSLNQSSPANFGVTSSQSSGGSENMPAV